MLSSGAGLTFTDHDVKMVRVVVGLLSRATFKDLDAAAVAEGGNAFKWIDALVQNIKDNVLDTSKMSIVEPAPPLDKPAKPQGKK